jgi:hypothetical protein
MWPAARIDNLLTELAGSKILTILDQQNASIHHVAFASTRDADLAVFVTELGLSVHLYAVWTHEPSNRCVSAFDLQG